MTHPALSADRRGALLDGNHLAGHPAPGQAGKPGLAPILPTFLVGKAVFCLREAAARR
jgi:hypothetical protein